MTKLKLFRVCTTASFAILCFIIICALLSQVEVATQNLLPTFTALSFIFILAIIYIILQKRKTDNLYNSVVYTDELTSIGNEKKFYSDAEKLLSSRGKRKFAVLYFDIDNFKIINDTFGYDFGDKVLVFIGNVLKETFKNGELYSRFWKDYFAVLMEYSNVESDLIPVVEQIIKKLVNITIKGYSKIDIPVSFGIYLIEENETDINKVVNRANIAREQAKSQRNKYSFFNDDIKSKLFDEIKISQDLKKAIEDNMLAVYYQPKFNLQNGKMSGMEALVRWQHPLHGFISPSVFIPIAEKKGLIVDVGRFVFEEVCKDLSEWNEIYSVPVTVCVNISRVELYQADLMDFVKSTINKYNIAASQIDIELTETAAISDLDYIKGRINEFKKIGFVVAMDDFGTGYSSLSCLKSIPIDVLKLDRSFLLDMENDERSASIVNSVIKLAKSLNFIVVAEGIETKEQSDYLKNIGCDIAQGFYFAKPMPKEDINKVLQCENSSNNSIIIESRLEECNTTLKKLELETIEFVTNFIKEYFYERDLGKITPYLSDEISFIGICSQDECNGFENAHKQIKHDFGIIPTSCYIDSLNISQVYHISTLSLITGTFSISFFVSQERVEICQTRISVLCKVIGNEIKIMHFHLSIAYSQQHDSEFYSSKNVDFLSQILPDESEELDLDSSNFKSIYYRLLNMTLHLEDRNKILSNMVSSDGLTNLYNHRHINICLDNQIELYKKTFKPFSILMIDIDNFKGINDIYGHLAGNDVLYKFSRIIQNTLKSDGIAGRYGGDEFLIILPNANLSNALFVAEKIKSEVESETFTDLNLNISTSIGVAEVKRGMNSKDLIKSADDNLYRAKASGKKAIMC